MAGMADKAKPRKRMTLEKKFNKSVPERLIDAQMGMAKKAWEVYTAPAKTAARIIGGITGSGGKQVAPIYKQMQKPTKRGSNKNKIA